MLQCPAAILSVDSRGTRLLCRLPQTLQPQTETNSPSARGALRVRGYSQQASYGEMLMCLVYMPSTCSARNAWELELWLPGGRT